MVVVVGVVRRHLLDARGDAPHRLDVRLRGCPAPGLSPYALPNPPGPRTPPCLSSGAYVALASVPLGSPPGPKPLALPRVLTSVTHVLARTADARVLPASLPMSLAVSSSADRAPPRPVRPDAARFGVLLTSLSLSLGAAA